MNLQTLIDNGVLNQCKFAEVTQIVLYYKDKEEYWNYFTNILFSSSFESSENRKFLTDKPYSINSKIKVIISREVISKENVYEILKNAENMQEWKWKDDVARLDSVFPIDSQFIPETDPTGCVTSDSSIVPIEMSLYGSNFFGGYYCCELFSAKKYLSNELSAKNIVAIQNIIKNANLVYDLENLSDRIGNIVCKVPVEVIEHKPLKLSPERGIKGEFSLADKNCKQLDCILQLISMCDNTIVNSQSYDIQFTINNSKHEYSIEPNKYKNMIILTEKNTGIIYYSAIRDYTFGSGYYATIKPPQFGVQSSLNRQLIIDGKSKTVPLTNIAGIGDITVEKEIYEIDKRQNHWRTEYQKQNYYFNAFIKGQEKEAIQTIVNICDDRSLFWDLKKIWLIDPYLSADDILNTVVNCSKYGVEINCLTHLSSIIDNPNTRIDDENGKTRKETIVEKYRTKLKKSIPKDTDFKLEYRNAGGEEGISFHDRYLILEYDINRSRVWSLGISVNSLGTSHHIIQIVESPNDVISTVKEIWNKCDLKENLIFKN